MREKRRFVRFDIAIKTAYAIQKDQKAEKIGITKDVSAVGIQLLTNDKIEPGEKVDLKIFVPDALNPVHIQGIAVWSKKLENPENYSYSAGIDFEKIEEDNKNTFLKFLCSLMHTENRE